MSGNQAPPAAAWSRRRLLAAATGSAACLAAPWAHGQAQAYPSRPVKLIVGYPAGGFTDIVMRVSAVEAEKRLGQSIVVENRPGAAGVTSFLAIKNAAPDGYTSQAILSNGVIRPLPPRATASESRTATHAEALRSAACRRANRFAAARA